MSEACKLSYALPKDAEFNGLDAWAARLVDQPDEPFICLAWVDAKEIKIDTDSGASVPVARIRRIEPLGEVADVPAAVKDAAAEAMQKRTGRRAIPFEMATVDEGYDPEQPELGDDA